MRSNDIQVQLADHLSAFEIASRVLGNPVATRQQKDRASAILQRAEAGVVRISERVISESVHRSSDNVQPQGDEVNSGSAHTLRRPE